jgi:perosamine synthetase
LREATGERPFIPVAEPALVGNEKKYVNDCLDSSWISSNGKYIERFEKAFAEFCGVRYAIACANGTAALHAALVGLGIGAGDEVIVPTLTYIATANAVAYCGARPVFVDSECNTWNLDPTLIESKVTERTKGIIPVHVYGHPADMDPVLDVARRHHLFVLEDAAEAHGADYKGRRVGSLGAAGVFSFYGNKVITTGEGGMVVTDDTALAARIRQVKGQGMDPARRYWFPMLGYNYRMTNIEAAIGLAQLEGVEWHIARRRENARWYRELLGNCSALTLMPEQPWAKSVFWMYSVVLDDRAGISRDRLMQVLGEQGIETRPFFYPLHTLPMYDRHEVYPVAEALARNGINLPSSAKLQHGDLEYVSERLIAAITAA